LCDVDVPEAKERGCDNRSSKFRRSRRANLRRAGSAGPNAARRHRIEDDL
jgi:hypothetical protein